MDWKFCVKRPAALLVLQQQPAAACHERRKKRKKEMGGMAIKEKKGLFIVRVCVISPAVNLPEMPERIFS